MNLKNAWDNFFPHTLFQIFKKGNLQIWKDLDQIFGAYIFSIQIWKIPTIISLLILLFKYLKKAYLNLKNTSDNFSTHTLFQIIKKAYLQIWKIPGGIFLLIPFYKYLKNFTYKSGNAWDNLFAQTLFQIFKKAHL